MNKGILLAITLLLSNIMLVAQDGIMFQNSEWAAVLEKAEKENKLVFVDAYTTWCGPCKQMSREVFTKKKVADFYNHKSTIS